MNKLNLQIATGLLGIVPVATGLLGMMGVNNPEYVAALWWLIPTIERQTVLFRVLWGMIFIGGIGRLLSIIMLGRPPVPFVAFTAIEIVGAPFFIWWQSCVTRVGK
jgi:hypothetical protein